jgi:regulator of nucleoside diphosphate kinase
MLLNTPTTSVSDRQRLLQALDRALSSWVTYAPDLEFFRHKVRRSQAVPTDEIPGDVITMNSRFALRDEQTGETICYTLVYPEEEAPHVGKLSVLSPMGMAMYGAKVGEEVCWLSAAGAQVATVKKLLYQPEAVGHHHR